MVWFRLVFGTLLFASLGCFVAYLFTRENRWRRLGLVIAQWTILAALGFFAVLIAQRLAGM